MHNVPVLDTDDEVLQNVYKAAVETYRQNVIDIYMDYDNQMFFTWEDETGTVNKEGTPEEAYYYAYKDTNDEFLTFIISQNPQNELQNRSNIYNCLKQIGYFSF